MRKSSSVFLALAAISMTVVLCGTVLATEITYDSGRRRDPFVPLPADDSAATASSSGIKLEGIIYDPNGQSMAVLNGQTYQVGDVAGDATVLKIQKDLVVISVGEEEQTLRIREEDAAS